MTQASDHPQHTPPADTTAADGPLPCHDNCRSALRPLRVRWVGVAVLAALAAALAIAIATLLIVDRSDFRHDDDDAAVVEWAGAHRHRPLLNAIWMVEASGRLHPPDGDGGRSIGPYQISRAYWQDAVAFAPEIGGRYEDCRNKAYAERVMLAYWQRYVPDGSDEYRARVHNGGPVGYRKAATEAYWQKVQRELAQQGEPPAR